MKFHPSHRSIYFIIPVLLLYSNSAESRCLTTTADTGIVKPGASPKLISRQFSFTEGASADKDGNVFFTDQPNNKIWKYDTSGMLNVFMENAGRSNGMYFDKEGNLVSCADEHDQLWSISPAKKVTVLVKDFHGHLFNGPNDLWINSKEAIYFTDPYYQREYWQRKQPDAALRGQHLYYMKNKTSTPIIADSLLKQPNGIVGTPDGKYLYVADMGAGKTFRYQINNDGSLSNKTIFVNQASDGMTLDDQGNVYLTGNGVTVYNSSGEKISQINIPEKWTANICFGGKYKDVLFITASEAVYTLEMNVKGVE